VQEVNTKRAKICLPPALCVAVIYRQTLRKAQENQRAYNMRLTYQQNKTTSSDTRDLGSTLGEAKIKIMILL